MPTFICFRLVEIPIACILAIFLGMGQNEVFWSIVIAESLLGILGIWLFTRGILKKKMFDGRTPFLNLGTEPSNRLVHRL